MIFDSLQQSAASGSGGDTGGSSGGGLITQDTVVTVGAAGDYPTITAALEYLSQLAPVFKAAGLMAEVRLLAGFVMAEQVVVEGLDLGWITITGVDSETTISRAGIPDTYGYRRAAFTGLNRARLPLLSQMFAMDGSGYSGGNDGVAVFSGSSAVIDDQCGFKNAGACGVFSAQGSVVTVLDNCRFDNCYTSAFHAEHGGLIVSDTADLRNTQQGQAGVVAEYGGRIVSHQMTIQSCYRGFKATYGGEIVVTSPFFSSISYEDFYVAFGGVIKASGSTGSANVVSNTITSDGLIIQ